MENIRFILFGILLVNLGFIEVVLFQGTWWIIIGLLVIVAGAYIAIKNIFAPHSD